MKNWEARIMGNKKAQEVLDKSYSDFENLKNISNRGGKRKGAGRPKLKKSEKKEPTVVKRIPISQVKNVENLLKKSNGK